MYVDFVLDSSDGRMHRENLYSSVLSYMCLLSPILMSFIPVPAEEIIVYVVTENCSVLALVSSKCRFEKTPTAYKPQQNATPQPS